MSPVTPPRLSSRRAVILAVCGAAALGVFAFLKTSGEPDFILRLVNFVVESIPLVISIALAFIPSLETRRRAHMRWRAVILIAGTVITFLMWYQQVLQIDATYREQNIAVSTAVQRANEQASLQLTNAKNEITSDTEQQVAGVRTDLKKSDKAIAKVTDNVSGLLTKEEGELNANIAKVGNPKPPPLPVLSAALWSASSPPDYAVQEDSIQPNSEGVFKTAMVVRNVSAAAAEQIDVWLTICDLCSFAKEPAGFSRPAGMGANELWARFQELNPGADLPLEKMAIKLAATTPPARFFEMGFKYSCQNCDSVSTTQILRISIIPPKPR